MWTPDRRSVLAGAAAAMTTGRVRAAASEPIGWSDQPAFPTGPLAAGVGRGFRAPASESRWPQDVPLIGPDGPVSSASWRGKTMLVALWAEWCAPCLAEMPSLSRLNRAYANARFEILPIATGTHALRTCREAQERLRRLNGVELPTLLDGSPRRDALMNTLSHFLPPPDFKLPPGATLSGGILPCLVVVDPRGGLRGRYQGGPGPNGKNAWDLPASEAFIKALAGGAAANEPAPPASARI